MRDSINSNLRIDEIVTKYPETSHVFEKYEMDYCCGSKSSLKEQALEDRIVLPEMIQELNERVFASEKDWLKEENLQTILDHIRDIYHIKLKTELPRIQKLLEKVYNEHGGRHPYLSKILIFFYHLREDLESHMEKEEAMLFPILSGLQEVYAKGESLGSVERVNLLISIEDIEKEHEEAGNILKDLRQLSNDYGAPVDACNSFFAAYDSLKQLEYDLYQHLHLENHVLYPLAKKYAESIETHSI